MKICPNFSIAALPALVLSALLTAGCRDAGPDGMAGNRLATALTVPPEFRETVLATLSSPTAMAFAPDGRLFVCEKGGAVRILKDGVLLPEPFLTRSVNSDGERGLLGLAFDPDYAASRNLFVFYSSSRSLFIARYTASASDPDRAEPGSERILFEIPGLGATNHNGGAIHFGPDGRLYAAVGENAVPERARSLETPFGKILRFNKDGSIPADNPFYGAAAGMSRAAWAIGLRNPFTFAFQPGTGRMFINDVGWQTWEEINEGKAGADYGWPTTEGPTTAAGISAPFHAYRNERHPERGGEGCAIVGAAFYDPPQAAFPEEYRGAYFFGDHCEGWIRRIDPATRAVTPFADGIEGLTDIEAGPDGALYYVSTVTGRLVRVTYGGSRAPSISRQPAGLALSEGEPAAFSVSASGAPPLAFQWLRDGAAIPGASASTYTLAAAQRSDSGARFRCRVSNADGNALSAEALLSVVANRRPTAVITGPDTAHLYRAGARLAYSGTGADPEDGALPASAFTWQVDLHHDAHSHPMQAATSGSTSGSLTVPVEGETSANVWLRVYLTVKDAGGLTHRAHRDIHPRKARVTLATYPPGLKVHLDGTPFPSPHTFTGVAGMRRSLGTDSLQTHDGKPYEFVSWSDGGRARHAMTTPDTDAAFTAVFREASAVTAPVAEILAPAADLLYEAGTPLAFSGRGTDPQDGDLPAGAFAWRVDLHHDNHVHPALAPVTGSRSGAFPVPDTGETSSSVFYRIHLTVRDKDGATHSSYRDVHPRKVRITLASEPAGIRLRLDGRTVIAPHAFTGVAGMQHALSAIDRQDHGNVPYLFQSWSQGGAASQHLRLPGADTIFTARFRESVPISVRPENLAP